ncbi:MAG: hypothetical protein NC110_03285 [Ruminococcus sp.]|nr:hypothetical protein [Ruminococcus sp.]
MPFTFATMYVEDEYKLSPKKKVEAVKLFLDADYENDDTCFLICNTSSSDGGFPEKNAVLINEFLESYSFISGKKYGIICMDFVTQSLAEKVYMTNVDNMINEPNEPVAGNSVYSSFVSWADSSER